MSKNTAVLKEHPLKSFADNYKKNIADVKNKSNNYLKNNNDKDFFEMIAVLKKMRYEQLIFPKKTRNEKTLQEIRKASLSLYKVHEKLKGCDTIEKEISKNKKLENGQTQTQTKNFDIFLKVKKQSLIAKINKTVYDINSVQLPMFDDIFNKISLEKRTKKLIQKINRLTKGLEKKIRIITSNSKVEDIETLKNRKATKEF
jgi:hypothetical protein